MDTHQFIIQLVQVTIWPALILLALVLFKKPLSNLINEIDAASGEGKGWNFTRRLGRDLQSLEQDAVKAAQTEATSTPGYQELETADASPSSTEDASLETEKLFALLPGWTRLRDSAVKLLDDNDVLEASVASELPVSTLLRVFEKARPGMLSPKANDLAVRAEKLYDSLTIAPYAAVNLHLLESFEKSLASLQKIVSIAESKARHPMNSRYWKPAPN